ncbi:serine hydrolase domain-containing protein [Paenibacillus wynnii]|uniref:serine hydrolase domain-containing protein n=1 Tax=Paenibacillus wynnii TaxID=268407 RepID=UPI0027951CFA|nr:serine hydrolase domain-containing protein [Paenibacillus wynnii]MDQ0193623.1 CubicO group peptidase (beta-lactamase class C family) [Paenibacillus wynnii]
MLNNRFQWVRRSLWIVLICTLFPVSAFASVPEKHELETFTDVFMKRSMQEHHVPGAVVSIVRDGRTTFIKGYGYADLDRQVPADPYKTVFRLGSISKLITATAVMQQYEAGRLDLHEDIKRYIPDLKLSYIDGKPITAHHLLTHTAGFYESIFGVGGDREKQLPLAEAIKNGLPDLVRKPGEQIAYSNQGSSLAGYLVEKVTNQPYEKTVEDSIFKPLHMNHSSFRLQESDPYLAKNYSYAKDNYRLLPYSYIHHAPAGAFNSTAEDMTRFMITHLQQGRYDDTRLFSEQTADLMHRTQFTVNRKMPGMAYGFFERYQNGLRLIEHDGGIDGFVSYLYLIPTEKTGIFISTNSGGGGKLTEQFIGAYLDRFYPMKQTSAPVANPTPVNELRKMEGYYIPNRAQLKGPINFGQNLSASKLKAVEDGIVTFQNDRYVESEPYLFRKENAQDLLYLDVKNGTFTSSSIPTMAYEHQSALYYPYFHLAVLLGLALIYPLQIVVSALRWLIGLIRRRRGAFDWLSTIVSMLFIVYFLFVVSIANLLVNEIPSWSYLLLYLPVLLLLVLLARLGISFALKRNVTGPQFAYAAATAIFVIYMYNWGFFSL